MINLPDVTLVNIDTFYHDLALLAIKDSCRGINFAKVLVFTDKTNAYKYNGIVDELVEIEAASKDEAARIMWYQVANHVETSHFLNIQWDGWVICPELWEDSWLEYDYIGSPWWCGKDEFGDLGVGNGGFSLRSKKLMELVATNPNFPSLDLVNKNFERYIPEDMALCRKYRRALEKLDFKWADETTASRFSFECELYKSFGFHSVANWPFVLNENEYKHRKLLAKHYIDDRNKIFFDLMNQNAKVVEEMGAGYYGFARKCKNIKQQIPSRQIIESLL